MHKMVVLAKAAAGQVDALAKWYDEVHFKDMLAVPGLVTAERHSIFPIKQPEGSPKWDFMLVYELSGADPMVVLKNMAVAHLPISELLESSSTLSIVGVSQGLQREV